MTLTSDIRRFEDSIADRIQRGIDILKDHQKRRAAYRRTFDELMALSDRDLRDLDISRADIPAIARDAADMA
ncbi:MAG: DUF1127 domain-containing protein [Rhodobacteraceae bacterium]|nr:DUF1127 domain-containing protein [Paracoccaceae bacterium]